MRLTRLVALALAGLVGCEASETTDSGTLITDPDGGADLSAGTPDASTPGMCDPFTNRGCPANLKCTSVEQGTNLVLGCVTKGEKTQGETCTSTSAGDDCADYYSCIQLSADTKPICRRHCKRNGSCPSVGSGTSRCLITVPMTLLPMLCEEVTSCNPLDQTTCPTYLGCYTDQCWSPGTIEDGARCTYAEDCKRGSVCVADHCAQICSPRIGGKPVCTAGICVALDADVGACFPVCNPLDQTTCPSDQGCYFTSGGDVCTGSGTVGAGGTCLYLNDCQRGFACMGWGDGYRCSQICDPYRLGSCPSSPCFVVQNDPDVGVCGPASASVPDMSSTDLACTQSWSPTQVDLGSVQTGFCFGRSIWVSSTCGAVIESIRIESASPDGGADSSIVLSGGSPAPPFTLVAGGGTNLWVQFCPTPGAHTATLTLTTGGGPVSITLTGTGVPPPDMALNLPDLAAAATMLAAGQAFPTAIAVDPTYVYWINNGSGGSGMILRAPLAGGAADQLAVASQPRELVVDGTNVYFTAGSSVMKVPIAGGMPVALAVGQSTPAYIAVDATYVYWTNVGQGALLKAPIAGGTATPLASSATETFGGLAIDATNAYFATTSNSGSGGAISKVPLSGGSAVALATLACAPYRLAVDASRVYFTSSSSCAGQISAVPIGGGSVVTLTTDMLSARNLAVDATSVYYTTFRFTADGPFGTVMRVPLSGGSAAMLAFGGPPLGLALDATNAYFSDPYNGYILKTAK